MKTWFVKQVSKKPKIVAGRKKKRKDTSHFNFSLPPLTHLRGIEGLVSCNFSLQCPVKPLTCSIFSKYFCPVQTNFCFNKWRCCNFSIVIKYKTLITCNFMSIYFKTMLWHSTCFFVNVYASLLYVQKTSTWHRLPSVGRSAPLKETVPSVLSVLWFF